ncbi:hypothetical protein BO70DRAFT_111368 [Aspergillus heteromorphus CBS 117.55]|uniref:Uncharacterized protein n=1 Tax=Aspergillus heteromorphus CBS 117.55 TaxID=1448321 RepID=A0A317VLE9_9EURO|nr:uncharacterized protein BO70DRAFT_111368 [Aspergillus heteromorphus CBS 117.55]PWY73692.1 hypothetical protein BO70DRAFT_111368 [Aspergillus heteromorphus CBS 117.55]
MGKFKWNRETLISYLGGDERDLRGLRIRLTDLLLTHDKLYNSCSRASGRSQQQEFILSVISDLPDYVQDASSNLRRMQGIMGLVCVIKRDHKAKQRLMMTAPTGNYLDIKRYDSSDSAGEESDGSEAAHETRARVVATGNETETESEPIEFTRQSSPAVTLTRSLYYNDLETDRASTIAYSVGPVERKLKDESSTPGAEGPKLRAGYLEEQSPHLYHDLLSRNIWVINEVNSSRHGLCTVQELTAGLVSVDTVPLLTELNFPDWLLIVKNQCGYDATVHRLEYRPSAKESPAGRPMTVPVGSSSQWRGALNAQLRAKMVVDPVFYLVFK